MSHPHVIVICSDQHRADTLGCAGHPVVQTPHLDRLAAAGLRLTHCFSQNPVCAPARAAMMTGCHHLRNGVPRNGYFCNPALPTMADVFGGAGYATAAFGKMHLAPHQAGIARAPHYGWQHLDGVEDNSLGAYFDWACAQYPAYRDYLIGCLFNVPENPDYWATQPEDLRPQIAAARARSVAPHAISATCNWGYAHYSPLPEPAHKSAWITDRALAYLDAHDPATPLLLWVGYVDPHNPFDPPARWRTYDPDAVPPRAHRDGEEADYPPSMAANAAAHAHFTEADWRTQRALYYGGVSFMDHQIGRLLDALEAKLDMANTIVVYLSDHGEHLGDHGICGKSAYHYDSGTRVPMLWRWDGRWPAGGQRHQMVEQTDLTPTLLDLAGVAAPPMDGQSFAAVLDEATAPGPRGYAYIESYAGGPEDPSPPPLTWARTIRTPDYRVTFYPDVGYGECFDLRTDPQELWNRWEDPAFAEIIDQHRQILLQRLILRELPLPHRPYAV